MKHFLFAAIFFSIISSLNAQKIAAVELDSIIQHLPDTRIAQAKLDSSISFLQQYSNYLHDSLQNVLQLIDHDGPVPAQQKLLYEEKLKEAQQRLLAFQEQAHTGLQEYRDKLFSPINAKARAICKLYAKANGYKVIVNKKNMDAAFLYGKTEVTDVTNSIIQKISNPPVPK